MTYQELIGRITEQLHICTIALSRWLERTLPVAHGGDWWNSGVAAKLSYNQREIIRANNITMLAGLDLSALLRVTDKNWYSIQERYFLKHSERAIISRMFGVRNNWAHSPVVQPAQEAIIDDLVAIEDFLNFVEAARADIRAHEQLLDEVRKNGISDVISVMAEKEKIVIPHEFTIPTEISKDSIVHLVSDPKTVGIVISVDKVGDTLRYTVFHDGKAKTYFESQIELVTTSKANDNRDFTDVQRILTAYQIKKPSSDSLYSLNAARIDFVPYQFRPALKLIKSDTPRLLIADSVGVGKTIEAGLILKEMQARTSLDTVLIICPKPLVAERKWELEMKRFDEDFTPVDGDMLRNIIREADYDGEWPDKYKRLIIPYSLLTKDLLEGKQTRGRKLLGLNTLDPAPIFDMVIVDEAHHIRNRNTQAYKAVEYFCRNANSVVFLTATPLQLGNEDLFTLLNLLYPDTVPDIPAFNAMAIPNRYINSAIHHLRVPNHENEALEQLEQAAETEWGRNVIEPNPVYQKTVASLRDGGITREQRVKLISDVELLHSFSNMINRTRRQDIEDFCIRRAYTLESEFTDAQRELHDSLLEFVADVLSSLHPTISLKFLMCTLRRQAASCIFGLAPFIRSITQHHLSNLTEDYDVPDDAELDDLDCDTIIQKAHSIISLAENLPSEDIKFDSLAEIIRERQSKTNNKMIIFSTFRHTLAYLTKKISAMCGVRVAYVDGSIKDADRYSLRERFARPKDDPTALDILLFTEVGSEGLDYQFCDTLVNYDLPWNPMRVEQRIGRIDRRGQKSDVAHIYNCVTKGTIDEEIFVRCLTRIGIFEHSIGDCSEILGEMVRSISDLILDPILTEEERSAKIEQLADNEVRKIQEMQRLEDDEKQIFGVDISSFVGDVEKADNPWLSSEALRRLVIGYLEKRIDEKKVYISDGRIKLSSAEKAILAEDYKLLRNSGHDIIWPKYLRSGTQACKIAFDQDFAKDPSCLFITPMHPLVRQAANFFFSEEVSQITFKVICSDMAQGKYPFQFYIWEYTGEKPQTRLIPVCTDKEIQNELPAIMQNAISSMTPHDGYESEWDKLAEAHLRQWQEARESFRSDTESLYRFKIESMTKSFAARKFAAERQIRGTENEAIITMRESEIVRLDGELASKKQKFEEIAKLADIHTTLLVNGVLIVEEV